MNEQNYKKSTCVSFTTYAEADSYRKDLLSQKADERVRVRRRGPGNHYDVVVYELLPKKTTTPFVVVLETALPGLPPTPRPKKERRSRNR